MWLTYVLGKKVIGFVKEQAGLPNGSSKVHTHPNPLIEEHSYWHKRVKSTC